MIIGGINPAKLTFVSSNDAHSFYAKYTDGKTYRIIYYNDNTQNRPIAIAVVEYKPFKMKVKSGNDGKIVLPIFNEDSIQIDWGDGTTLGKDNIKLTKLASTDMVNLKLASLPPSGYSHTYSEQNKEYIVTVYGLTKIGNCRYDKENILEILQWGNTGLTEVDLIGCTNLSKIADPDQDSFKDLVHIYLNDTAWYNAQPIGPVYLGNYYCGYDKEE